MCNSSGLKSNLEFVNLTQKRHWKSRKNDQERYFFQVILKSQCQTANYTPFWKRLHVKFSLIYFNFTKKRYLKERSEIWFDAILRKRFPTRFNLTFDSWCKSKDVASSSNKMSIQKTTAVASTRSGVVRGLWKKSSEGQDFVSFRGIPYAEAPVQERRFRLPVPIRPWDGILDAASKCGPDCPQYNPLLRYSKRVPPFFSKEQTCSDYF